MNNSFTHMLRASGGRPPIGTWLVSGSSLVAEAVGCAGFDWAVIDMARGPGEVGEVLYMLQALAGTKTLPVVRIPSDDAATLQRVLDAGAATLMFPLVQSAEEARRAVAATRFPPEGVRGAAAMSRASRFGTAPNSPGAANPHIAVIVETASMQAIEQLDAMAQVDGVDAFFLDALELSARLGHAGRPNHPDVVAQIARAVQCCKALGKPIGTAAPTLQLAAQYRASGFDFIAVASDLGLLMNGAQGVLAALHTSGDEHVHALAPGTRTATSWRHTH